MQRNKYNKQINTENWIKQLNKDKCNTSTMQIQIEMQMQKQ